MRQNRSKGLISARASEKKKVIVTFAQKSPGNGFLQLGTNVPLMDVVNCDKFCDNLFKV